MKEELEAIEALAQYCDEDLLLELNQRLRAILDWVSDEVAEIEPKES